MKVKQHTTQTHKTERKTVHSEGVESLISHLASQGKWCVLQPLINQLYPHASI